jgi:hypothetical protein
MAENPTRPEGVRLSVTIPHAEYERLMSVRARLHTRKKKRVTNQDLVAEWIGKGLDDAEAELSEPQ